jgi:phage terminase small subunit
MSGDRALEVILADLASVQDELISVASDDFATRAELSNRQDALRREAAEAREAVPDYLTVEQLEADIAHLEAEILAHLESRPAASSGAQTGFGGGIDPQYLHGMHREMAKSFGLEEKQKRLQLLKGRFNELAGP